MDRRYTWYIQVRTGTKNQFDKFESLVHDGGDERFLALVEFHGNTFRFGIANDEVFQGLPYYKRGIEGGQIIENSRWIAEIKQTHKINPYFNEARWTDLKHYLLLFKEEILDVIAPVIELTSIRLHTIDWGRK